jgi:hypothetical protein
MRPRAGLDAVLIVTVCSQYVLKEGLSVFYYFMFLTLLNVCPVCHLSVSVKSFTSCHTDNSMGPLLVSTCDIAVCLQSCRMFRPTKEGSLSDVS